MKKAMANFAFLPALMLGLGGCPSQTKQIAENSVHTTDQANSTIALSGETRNAAVKSKAGSDAINSETTAAQQDLANALQTGDVGPSASPHIGSASSHLTKVLDSNKEVSSNLTAIIAKQDSIKKAQTAIIADQNSTQVALTGTQDKESQFTKNLKSISVIVVVLGIAFVSIYYGLGPLVRNVLVRFGRGIPKTTASLAKMDVESLENGKVSQTQRERIAIQRATDPAYDKAFTKHKASKKPTKRRKRK